MNKLAGRTDVEDALVRLDGLTQEEVLMADAEVLKITSGVDDDFKICVIDEVAGSVPQVDNTQDVRLALDDRVRGVDDNVSAVVDGAQFIFTSHPYDSEYYIYLDIENLRKDMRESADDVLLKTRP